MKIALWIVQVLVALAFLFIGATKAFLPMEEVFVQMPPLADVPPALVRFIGIAELAGAVGVILPALTRILPFLTPLAAAGLALITTLASIYHLTRGEFPLLVGTIFLGGLAAFIVWGRWKRMPIQGR